MLSKYFNYLRDRLNLLPAILSRVDHLCTLEQRITRLQEAVGRVESRQLQFANLPSMADNEFQVYSQWGEDGIIEYLLRHVPVSSKRFVEFGVEDYLESNTRFLLVNRNWSGLVIDGSPENIASVKQSDIYWRHNLKAVDSFVTKDNINGLLKENGMTGDIGLLSVDIDGNDYWVWEAITDISPRIVICEYNFRFGPNLCVTIPYNATFVRTRDGGIGMIAYGASLQALCSLANKKGYAFVGCSQSGVNAFFVRRDLLSPPIRELTPAEGYVQAQVMEVQIPPMQQMEMVQSLLETGSLVEIPLVQSPAK